MFTGIVEALGEVKRISKRANISLLEIKADKVLAGTKVGDSISVNGVCLTVIKVENDLLSFEVIPETANLTNLGKLRIGEKVNLERALRLGEQLSGHFVTGHIDCLGIIRRKIYLENNFCFEIAVPQKFMPHLVAKGSVAVDGISLTVVDAKIDSFTVYIIPHTLRLTTLGFRETASKVNVELDILSKYALKAR